MALVDYSARLLETFDVGPAIRHFVFEVPAVEQFNFTPGQWLSFTDDINGKKITRAYSLASLPEGNRFEICLNRVEGGLFSPHLFQLKPGDEVPFKGPIGSFTLRNKEREAVFVATGTGVVPYRGILRQPGYLESGIKATLIFGTRYAEGLIFKDTFEQLAAAHPNFRFLPTVTRPNEDWKGLTGRVQPLLWETIGDRTDLDVYVCGLKEMVDDVRENLKARGFDRKQIIFEKYD